MALNFNSVLPEGVALYDFQQVGVAYALATGGRTIIGDEMGLGKTIQALVTLQLRNAFPAVVVCPASLKGNWVKEIHRNLPGRTVEVAKGRTPRATTADVLVINYDILGSWEKGLNPSGLVFDESHYCKSADAARTKTAIRLAAKVPADGAVLLLTGTALLNRPVELLAQLQILGKLEEVTGPAKNPAGKFLFRYCGAEKNRYGTTFKGSTNEAELQTRLRSSCFVRRLRKDALGMNDTVRIPLTLSLNGDLDAYRRAEKDFGSYLTENGKVNSGDAEAIRQLTELRKLAGLAKVPSTIEWIENWLTSNDKSIVVFAWHVAVQQALVAHFGCPSILAGQSTDKTEAAKEIFQAKGSRVIVLSILAAKEGHTLTAASDVLFVEQPWNPGVQQQAEDRTNRIGQEAAQCFATSLLAEDTVDEMVYELIESKRAVIKAVMDTGVVDGSDTDLTQAVMDFLRNKYAR
jgi:SWI/SNF-related matrix-associated actin-dependent regulator 1 of chromatin subfamily A